jgi:hypothetical protein
MMGVDRDRVTDSRHLAPPDRVTVLHCIARRARMRRFSGTSFVIRILPVFALGAAVAAGGFTTSLPVRAASVKFAVIGDNGTGRQPQYDVARQMALARDAFPFDLVLMLGDNFYGSQTPRDLVLKFEEPYRPLLDAAVEFRAALGNHDEPASVNYRPLGMNGQRYYTFARANVRFVVLDTNFVDSAELRWADDTLNAAQEEWKICYFHHPIYGNAGRHGSNLELRVLLEPILTKHGVQIVFAGHDHVYERLTMQKGIQHFVVGSSGQLRKGDLEPSGSTAAGFDQDQAFLLMEIDGAEMYFETISRTGTRVDSGGMRLGPSLSPAATEGTWP